MFPSVQNEIPIKPSAGLNRVDRFIYNVNISVIIPAINESPNIAGAIESAWKAGAREVIVSDGGSSDETLEIAESRRCQIAHATQGRGPQQNAGAELASGDVLLFLHADARLGVDCGSQIQTALDQSPDAIAGGFCQQINKPGLRYRWLEKGNAARVHWQKLVYGDQGLFVRTSVFRELGGFPNFPIMEDFELSRMLSKKGSIILLDGPIQIDARRWESNGVFRQTARNWTLASLYRCGVPPQRLAKYYRPHSPRRPASNGQSPVDR